MTTATSLPRPDSATATALDLQTGVDFEVDCVVDHEAADNSGLIPAVAALLIDLYRKRRAAPHHTAAEPGADDSFY